MAFTFVNNNQAFGDPSGAALKGQSWLARSQENQTARLTHNASYENALDLLNVDSGSLPVFEVLAEYDNAGNLTGSAMKSKRSIQFGQFTSTITTPAASLPDLKRALKGILSTPSTYTSSNEPISIYMDDLAMQTGTYVWYGGDGDVWIGHGATGEFELSWDREDALLAMSEKLICAAAISDRIDNAGSLVFPNPATSRPTEAAGGIMTTNDVSFSPNAEGWVTLTAYVVGDFRVAVAVPDDFFYECTVAGTSGATEPTWSGIAEGETIVDATATWTKRAMQPGNNRVVANFNMKISRGIKGIYPANAHPAWGASVLYAVGDYVTPTPGNYAGYTAICSVAGISDTTEPTWTPLDATPIVDNAATWIMTDNLRLKQITDIEYDGDWEVSFEAEIYEDDDGLFMHHMLMGREIAPILFVAGVEFKFYNCTVLAERVEIGEAAGVKITLDGRVDNVAGTTAIDIKGFL